MSKTHIGECIYCGKLPALDDPLSDEHILPFGIYGTQTLGRASCRKCAAITSAFEAKVQKDDMAGLRYSMNFPSRHKKDRTDLKLPMEIVTRSGEVKEIRVPPKDYYPVIVLPVFDPPAHIDKREYQGGIELVGYTGTRPKRSPSEILEKYDATEIATYSMRWPEAWARMFAKIGYAFAVKQYGLDKLGRQDVYVLEAIMGTKNDIGMWVGCLDEPAFEGEKDQVIGLSVRDGEDTRRDQNFFLDKEYSGISCRSG